MNNDTPTNTAVMGDFVFGGIEADEQQLLETERALRTGIRHRYEISPFDPAPEEAVSAAVYVAPDVHIDRLTAYVTTDGSDPAGKQGNAENGFAVNLVRDDTLWEPLIWNYIDVWRGEIPGVPAGTQVYYRIEGWSTFDKTISVWSREQNLDRSMERPTLYGYHVDDFAPPQWAHEAIVYQVFVDRFSVGKEMDDDNRWLEVKRLNDFYGGTLRGVTDRLDYIAELGVTALWLSPIFKAESYHGYDTTDYYMIDPRFGSNGDMHALVAAAHKRNLKVILDFVVNHTSQKFVPFSEALGDPHSPYRNWFSFGDAYEHGYRTFFDVETMPQINTENADARQFLFDAAQFWLREFGVDGYRLDYAAGPSHAFWGEFRARCRATRRDCWLFGEVTRTGDLLRTYMGRLDGCLDFSFGRDVRRLCAFDAPQISIGAFASQFLRSRRFFGGSNGKNFVMPCFLDNHDMNRFLWMAGNQTERLKLAAGIMFALGGPPILYYGTEIGLSQPRTKGPWREESRHPMWWDFAPDDATPGARLRPDVALLAYFKELIGLRRQHLALCYGDFRTRVLDEERGVWVLERWFEGDGVLIGINCSGEKFAFVDKGKKAVELEPMLVMFWDLGRGVSF